MTVTDEIDSLGSEFQSSTGIGSRPGFEVTGKQIAGHASAAEGPDHRQRASGIQPPDMIAIRGEAKAMQ